MNQPERCPKCGGPMPEPNKTGRPRKFCGGSCRRANWRHARGEQPKLEKWKR